MSQRTLTGQRPTSAPLRSPVRGVLQRACACGQHTNGGECASCQEKREGNVQRAAVKAAPPNQAPPIVHEVLRASGQPLDAITRAFMEPRFRHDFSRVRVHTDSKAAESARAVSARAYTVGRGEDKKGQGQKEEGLNSINKRPDPFLSHRHF